MIVGQLMILTFKYALIQMSYYNCVAYISSLLKLFVIIIYIIVLFTSQPYYKNIILKMTGDMYEY